MNSMVVGQPSERITLEKLLGAGVFLLALAFYGVLAPHFAVPGRWSDMLATFAGLDPMRPAMRPLWSGLQVLLAKLPVANLALAAHLLSAVMGAGVCWLLYEVVRRAPFLRGETRPQETANERMARVVAGLSAAAFSAVSSPVMIASTRGDFALFGCFMILLAVYPSMLYRQRPRPGYLYASFICYGLGLPDYPMMLALLPLLSIWWLVNSWSYTRTRWSTFILAHAACLLAAAAVVLAFSYAYADTAVAQWRDLNDVGPAAKEFAKLYFLELTRSVPRTGWLIIMITTFVPFVFVVLRRFDEPTDKYTAAGVYAFRLVLLAVAVVILFDLRGSPARVVGSRVLLVAPNVLTAAWFGILLGYHYLLLRRQGAAWPRYLYVAALVAAFGYAAAQHAPRVAVHHLQPVSHLADQIVGQLEGRSWLITDGTFDSSLRLAARRQGVTLHLLPAGGGPTSPRSRQMAALFDDTRLQTMAAMGLRPLMAEWLRRDEAVTGKVAALVSPEIFESARYAPRPARVLYYLVAKEERPAAEALFGEHAEFWNGLKTPDLKALVPGDAGWAHAFFAARWTSRIANDLGVQLEGLERPDLARQAYEQALELWPDNMSATLNLLSGARRDNAPEVPQWETQLKEQGERNKRYFSLQFVPQVCGAVRDPGILMEQADTLGRSGQLQQALERLDQASGLVGETDAGARLSLARLYLRVQKPEQSEQIYKDILREKPDDLPAISGLLRVALYRRDFASAEQHLQRMSELGVSPMDIAYERASLTLAAGKVDEAKAQFLDLARQPSAPLGIWYNLAIIGLTTKDASLFEQAAPSLESNRYYLPGMLLLGEWAMRQGDFTRARGYLDQALALDRGNIETLEQLVQLDYAERNANAIREHAPALLAAAPDSALGHFAAANIHLLDQRLDLAEASLRRCLEIREMGQAVNDLAAILSDTGRLDEALTRAKRAAELMPNDPNTLETLATVYLRRNEIDQAIQAIERAQDIAQGRSPLVLLTLAEAYLAKGRISDAGRTLDLISPTQSSLSPDRASRLEALRARIN